jgi:hypothetical protein
VLEALGEAGGSCSGWEGKLKSRLEKEGATFLGKKGMGHIFGEERNSLLKFP